MDEPTLPAATRYSRRSFLHALSAAGAAAAALPAHSAFGGFAASPAGRIRVGIVPAGFDGQDALSGSWSNGLRMALASVPGVTLDTATRADIATAIGQLARDGADVIVGALTPDASGRVAAALHGSRAVFLNAEPGAHALRPKDRRDTVFHHTLQLWQANFAAGSWAAKHVGTRAASLCSFHDSGFDTASAFAMGFEASGGKVVAKGVTHVPGRAQSVASVVAQLRAAQPGFIYVSAGGAHARELLAAAGPDAIAAPQARAEGGAELAFSAAYRGLHGRKPDAFALLGYEAGELILASARDAHRAGDGLRAALTRAEFEGPRGRVVMNASTHTTTAAYVDSSGAPLRWLSAVPEHEALNHPDWQHAVSGSSLTYAVQSRHYRV